MQLLPQLTAAEMDAIEHRLDEQGERLRSHPPFRIPARGSDDVCNVPFFKVVADEFDSIVWERLRSDIVTFKPDDVIVEEGELNDGIWFIRTGIVRLQTSDGNPSKCGYSLLKSPQKMMLLQFFGGAQILLLTSAVLKYCRFSRQ